MAKSKYTLRQYRTALKAYQKKISEYVGYEGRTYSSKYYEKQHEIELFENMIKNRTYTNQDIAKMMRIVKPKDKTWVTDYVVQYSAEKDKFVSPITQPVYKKREGEVPSVGEAIHEVRKHTAPKKKNKPITYDEDYAGFENGTFDYYTAFFDNLYYYVSQRLPWSYAQDVINRLDEIDNAHMPHLYEKIEGFAKTQGLNIANLDSKQMTTLINFLDILITDAIYNGESDYDDQFYEESEFGDL